MIEYNFKEAEKEFQDKWNFSTEFSLDKQKYYILNMFPYPSGNIHVGHLRNYTIGDVIARYKRALGFNVFHPIGWDAFGLPAENAAILNNSSPKHWTETNIAEMRKQLKKIGLSYDWSRELATCDPKYYKHEQKIFIDFFNNGLAYKKESEVNWDPVDNTVLANEQVVDGKGWRSGAVIEKKTLSQWFLKITDFAEELLNGLNSLKEWPEKVKTMQKKWIGKSTGVAIEFKLLESDEVLKIFTTRPETIFGATFCALAPEHPLTKKCLNDKNVQEFLKNISSETNHDAEKLGVLTKLSARHPFLDDKIIPIYIVNFVSSEHGTGAIFCCPAHDKNDNEFAIKYNLPSIAIIDDTADKSTMINSDFLNGHEVIEAKKLVIEKIKELGIGEEVTHYRLKDWGISRQRYWGAPIPIIYCDNCGIIPVRTIDLPITLPEDVDLSSYNTLQSHPTWKHTVCHKCNRGAIRETDTFDTFFESSWYFVAFCSGAKGIDKDMCEKFLPVDCYIGGIEHAVMHLLYARFFVKALQKCSYFNLFEPFTKLITQGMVCHKTYKDEKGNWISPKEALQRENNGKYVEVGRLEKMSKSKKNVIDVNEMIDRYGADSLRFFILSDNPIDNDMEFSIAGLEKSHAYIKKIHRLVVNYPKNNDSQCSKKVTSDFYLILKILNENLAENHLNVVIAKIHEMTNLLSNNSVPYQLLLLFVRILEPFIPHIAEHLWQQVGEAGSVSSLPWPVVDCNKIIVDSAIKIAVQLNGKVKKIIEVELNCTKEALENLAISSLENKISKKEIKKIIVVPLKIVNIVI